MKQFSVDLLNALHAPVNHQNVASLVGWEAAEGGSSNNNPFNTTEGGPAGTTEINSVGVKDYPSYQAALHATLATLHNGDYNSIVGALHQSNPSAFINAVGSSPWGTSGSLLNETVHSALGQNFGVKASGAIKGVAKQRTGMPKSKTTSQTITDPGVTTKTTSGGGLDVKSAVLNALLTPTPINTTTGTPSSSNSLLSRVMANVNSGAYTTPVVNTISKSAGQSTTLTNKTIAQGRAGGKGAPPNGGGMTPKGGGYINPLQGVTQWERTDQGVDATMKVGAPIKAPGDVKILGIEPGWYNGQPFVYFQFLNGPLKGKVQYVAEQIDNIARVGSVIKEGGTIARFAPSGTAIEYGWATPSGQTLAMATSGYKEGYATGAGNNLRRWLNQHGANAGTGVGLSIGAGPDIDDSAAALAQIRRAVRAAITTPGVRYYKPKYAAPASDD